MKTVYQFKVIILMLYITACGGSGGGGASTSQAPSNPAAPIVQPTNPGGGGATTFPLTYYTLVENVTVDPGAHHIARTGHCVVYNSQTYCWDDGWQTIPAISYETDFWGLCDDFAGTGQVGECSGGGSNDPVTHPTLWTAKLLGGSGNIPTPIHQPSDVFSGIATPVTCTLTGAIVDCVDFQIDTAQVPL